MSTATDHPDTASPLVRSPREAVAPRPETIVADWLSALEASEKAILTSTRFLPPRETERRLRRLRAERGRVARELEPITHGHRGATILARCLDHPTIDVRLLGLPDGVSACVFDVEGTLAASAAVHCEAWRATLDPFLLAHSDVAHWNFAPFDAHHDYETYLAGRPRLAGLRGFLASRGIALPEGEPSDRPGAESVHGLANRKNDMLRHYVERNGVEAFAGARAYLELARVVGVRRAAVAASANTRLVLQKAGLDDLIEECVDGTVLEAASLRPKPAPDMMLAASARLGVDPSEAAAFETTPAGIAGARAAGVCAVVGLARDEYTGGVSGADLVFNDLGEMLECSL